MSERNQVSTYLVMRLEDEPERVIVWDTLDISVGRLDSQDIEVSDPEVSRQHALLKHEGDVFTVEDLGTGLGTLVDGEPIRKCELQNGAVITIGKLELRFGQTPKRINPGPTVSYASVLKGGSLPTLGDDASGRTMLGFDLEDDLLAAPPTTAVQQARPSAVAADGTVEASDGTDCLDLGVEGTDLGIEPETRDLDKLLAERPEDLASGAPTVAALGSAPIGNGSTSECAREIVVSIDGPASEVEGLLSVIGGKCIQIGSLRLRIARRG